MARDLKLQVVLDAVDRVTRPLKQITQGSGRTAEALKASRDQLKTLERAQRDLRGFRDLKRQSESSSRALEEQQQEIRELSRQMQNAEGDTKALGRQRAQAIRQAQRLKEQYQQEQRQLDYLRRNMTRVEGVTGSHADQQRELTRRIREANGQLEAQQRQLRQTAQRQRQAADAAKRYHRDIGRAGRMAGAGAAGMATGGAALYGGARMLTPGVDYGAAMSRVQALTRLQEDDPRLQALRDQARELGSSTSFSATQAADAQGFLAMAGFDPDAIRAAMPSMLDLAKANDTGLGRTSDIASNLLSGFGLDPSEMERLGDVITATTTRANVNLEMLGESMKYVAPVAREMGLSLEESAAMAGLLGNVGIQGSQAGTTLRAMMLRLSAPTGAAAGAIEELGLNIKDAEGNMRNVPQILADVAQATEDLGNAERMEYLKAIFGEEPAAGMAEMINQQGSAGVEAFTGILENAAGENARMARTMADNISGDLKSLNSAWEEVGITITDTNEGPLRELIQNITTITRGVGNWMKQNPRLTGTLATAAAAVAALVAVGGSFIAVLGSVLGPIALVRYALTLLSLNPVGLTIMGIVAAVAALAAGATLIYRNWDGISAWFGERWQDIKDAFSGGIGEVARLLLDWSPIGLIWRGVTAGLDALGVEIPEKFGSLGSAMIDGMIDGLTGKIGELRDRITGIAGNVRDWFADKLDINSPSRVFAQLGGYTVDGLNAGLDAQRDEPARRVGEIARRVRQAGAGMAIGAASLPAIADVPIDHRPPLQAAGGGGDVHITIEGGINVHAAPGMDEQALARMVGAEVQRAVADAARDAAARRRSSFYDID
ncbi:phage tail tape measure protein [Halomonas sp. HG01]|uniref:phage tail tape measure protein n=1 Tax=Halomonas sp. HG01 TaxID=1609967 RepID=UPI000696D5E6|nr:phage tail tape measure protein [Halomonas sp. HG01]